MLVHSYRMEIFNNECMPGAQTVQCFAHLDQDAGQALPYLNASLGGFEYIREPPSVTFRSQGKLMTVHGRKIAVNALKDEEEARKIVDWLVREINTAWARRADIEPCFQGMPRPGMIDILRLLPKTNCGACGAPTCLVFATRVAEGAKNQDDCPSLGQENRAKLAAYLKPFRLGC